MRGFLFRYSIIFCLLLGVADGKPKLEYFGLWHNKKNEFKTMAFDLHKNGKGVFHTAIGEKLPLQWERTSAGVKLKIADHGRTIEMQLTYDEKSRTLILADKSNDGSTFWRVYDEEGKRLKTAQTETISSRDVLLQKIREWAQKTPPEETNLFLEVSSKDATSPWEWSCWRIGDRYYMTFELLRKAIDNPTSIAQPGYHILDSSIKEPDLPLRFKIPQSKADAFKNWLISQEIRFSDKAMFVSAGDSYERYSVLRELDLGRDTFYLVINYLMNDLFRDTKPVYAFYTTTEKMKSN